MSGERDRQPSADPPRAVEARTAAEDAIERALAVLELASAPSVDQLSDLADAIDSLNEGAFDMAADLAQVAQRRRTLAVARRPQHMAKTLPDLKAAFEATCRFRAVRDLQN